ncbi:MAG TPA: hypothetical protein VFW40_13965 [Capsulimonadaceae bacterium]|nr:hypothetical protein [Capsulimonadaceae bacterium]
MTISQFLETEDAKSAQLKTDFATCEIDERVSHCLTRMREDGIEWMGLIDDEYPTGGVRRQDLIDAIEAKKPDERWLVEKSSVGPYAYPMPVGAHPGDDALEIARRLAYNHQRDLLITDEQDQPIAVIDATALTDNPRFREPAQAGFQRVRGNGEPE